MSNTRRNIDQYWKKNIQIVSILLVFWFLASFGFGIIFADNLDEISFFGFKLGFWFAQQGSIYVFVMLIITYVIVMNKIDQKYKGDTK